MSISVDRRLQRWLFDKRNKKQKRQLEEEQKVYHRKLPRTLDSLFWMGLTLSFCCRSVIVRNTRLLRATNCWDLGGEQLRVVPNRPARVQQQVVRFVLLLRRIAFGCTCQTGSDTAVFSVRFLTNHFGRLGGSFHWFFLLCTHTHPPTVFPMLSWSRFIDEQWALVDISKGAEITVQLRLKHLFHSNRSID